MARMTEEEAEKLDDEITNFVQVEKRKDGERYYLNSPGYGQNRLVWDLGKKSNKSIEIKDLYKIPFTTKEGITCFKEKNPGVIDWSNVTGKGLIGSRPMPSTNTAVINTNGTASSNGNVSGNNRTKTATLRFKNYKNKDYTNRTINITYDQRNCYALYDGETEVPVGNTTWDDLKLKDTRQSGSGSSNGDGSGGGTTSLVNRDVYVFSQ